MSLTTGPGMKEIKRIGADFYQFNSQKREPNIWKIFHIYFLSAFQLLFALFVQSLFQFAWSSGQLTESSDKLMQQWEYDLWTKWKDKFREPSAGLVFINRYLHKIWLRSKYLQHFVPRKQVTRVKGFSRLWMRNGQGCMQRMPKCVAQREAWWDWKWWTNWLSLLHKCLPEIPFYELWIFNGKTSKIQYKRETRRSI